MTLVDPQASEVRERHAFDLARAEQRRALRDEWANAIELQPSEGELSTTTITQAMYRGALIRLHKIAGGEATFKTVDSDGETVVRHFSEASQLRAAELIVKLRMDEARLLAEMGGAAKPQPQVTVNVATVDPEIPREEKVAILRALAKRSA